MVKLISQIAILSLVGKRLRKITFSNIFFFDCTTVALSPVLMSATEAFCISLAIFYSHSAKVVK